MIGLHCITLLVVTKDFQRKIKTDYSNYNKKKRCENTLHKNDNQRHIIKEKWKKKKENKIK